jgi:hypothetical protein
VQQSLESVKTQCSFDIPNAVVTVPGGLSMHTFLELRLDEKQGYYHQMESILLVDKTVVRF